MTPRPGIDYILDVSFDSRDAKLEETVTALLFLTASTGSTSSDVNGTTTISAWFDSPADREAAQASLAGVIGLEIDERDLERIDWLERYEQSLEPLLIGSRFVVVPDARLLPTEGHRLSIVVPQEQAFGTGSHETTALCITLLETLDVAGRQCLDIGAGSGILAIAMQRLGAGKVVALDNDLDAYAALRENRGRNAVPESAMPLFIGALDALRGGHFDVVTMNIVPEIILPLLPSVVARLANEARLVLSGILTVRRGEVVRAAATHGLHLLDEREKGEWWAGVFGFTWPSSPRSCAVWHR